MGYKRCAIQECPSRMGQGIQFKYFPKKEDQAQRWLSVLPPGFKVTTSTALCEKHFGEDQFENIRVDGKRKFRDSPVPSFPRERKVLGDISNLNCTPQRKQSIRKAVLKVSPCISDHPYATSPPCPRKISEPQNENEAIGALLMLSGISGPNLEQTEPVSNPTDSHIDNSGYNVVESSLGTVEQATQTYSQQTEPASNPTDSHIDNSGHNVVGTLHTVELSLGTVEQATQTFSQETEPTSNLTDSHTDNNGYNVVGTLETVKSSLILCEVTGLFVANSTPNDSTTENQSTNNSSDLEVIHKQRAIISHLLSCLEEKDKQLMKFDKLMTQNANLQKKYDTVRKKNERLKSKLARDLYSPWLTEFQTKILSRKSTRGIQWTSDLIREGLILKMQCGTSGYNAFVRLIPLLPSVRALQAAVQFIRFDSGLLNEVFDMLEIMAGKASDMERDCQIVLDEMSIEKAERYCHSLKKMVGRATFPTHTGLATKALVIMLAGVARRWKIAVAVYLTNQKEEEPGKTKKQKQVENKYGNALKDIINQVIVRTEKAKLKVCGITSDMGPDNLAFWRACGITGNKREPLISSFPNPARPDEKIFVLPDAVHLFKSIKSAMESNEIITLPDDIVAEENLTSAVVDYNHIDDLFHHEESAELKVAFRLREENIHCNKQFAQMNVGTHRAVVCHRTAVGLNLLAEETENDSYRTTAFFVILLNTFFQLAVCRYKGLAVSKEVPHVYEEAIKLINRMAYIFQHMKVGTNGHWKPIQRGMRVLCASLLGLQEYFLERRKYKYVMFGRFVQDCIENLFSLIRLRQPIPHAVAFFQTLKVITLAQYSIAVKGSSYDYEESDSMAGGDFLAEARNRARERATERFYESLEELFANPIPQLTVKDLGILTAWEQYVLYDMCGSAVAGLKSMNITFCQNCLGALRWQNSNDVHEKAVITEMKEFSMLRADAGSRQLQIHVSDEVYKALLTAEVTYRLYRGKTLKFKTSDVEKYFVDNLMYVWSGSQIPQCHNIGKHLLTYFIRGKLKDTGRKAAAHIKASKTCSGSYKSSKSTAMHVAADNMDKSSK